MGRAPAALAALTACLLAACGGGDGPNAGLEEHLVEVAAAHDAYFDEHGEYPDPFEAGEELSIGKEDERWNLVAYYGRGFGYCLEGDDDKGTWHLTRDADELVEGECPGS